jgi:CHAT domain-containing protein
MWRVIGDRSEELKTLLSMSTALRDSENPVRAMSDLTRALDIAKAGGFEKDRAEVLRAISVVHLRNEDADAALDNVSKAMEISRSTSDRNGIAEGMLTLGDVYYFKGDFAKAADGYREAYAIWEDLQHRRGQAQALLYLADLDSDRNEFDKALDGAERARSLFQALDDDLGEAKAVALLGRILSSTGHKQEALERFEKARSVLLDSSDLAAQAALLNSTARVYADLGNFDSALPFSKLALQHYSKLGDRVSESLTLEATGLFYFAAGDLNNARLLLERALKGFQNLSNRRFEAYGGLWLGMVHRELGETKTALDNLNRSLEMVRVAADRRIEAAVLLALGRMRDDTSDHENALKLYRESLRLQRATEDRFGELAALYQIAICLRHIGEIGESLTNSGAAIEIIEKMRSSLASHQLRTSYFASARQHFDLYIDSLMRMPGDPVEPFRLNAFEASEMARARGLVDSIAEARLSISEGVDRSLVDREAALRAQIDLKSEQYTQRLSTDSTSKELSPLNDELRRLNAAYDELLGELRVRSPRYATLVQPQPLRVNDIQQQLLDSRSLLLEYALGDEKSYLWAVTQDSFASYVLPKRSEIDSKVRRLRDLMTAPIALPGEKPAAIQARLKLAEAQYPEAAAELSRMLLGPVADRLGSHRLVIVADGVLQYLPFGALPTPRSLRNSSFTPLIVDHEIVNLPSASTLAVIRREAPLRRIPDRTVAIFADPVFEAWDPRVRRPPARASQQPNPSQAATRNASSLDQVLRRSDVLGQRISLPRLPATRQEADAILALASADQAMSALGFNATKTAAMNPDLKRYRIVHFATHTILNDDHPDLSSLVLSLVDEKGNPQSGFLRLRDMYNLQLAAELVVLSACETALGKEVKGEGLISMVRGFMYSGTPRVLASLWKVSDEATAELMAEFYKHLLKDGETPAEALRHAQITQLQKKSRQSPYYWAAFQLQGEWN